MARRVNLRCFRPFRQALSQDPRLSARQRARILAGCYAIPTHARLRPTTA